MARCCAVIKGEGIDGALTFHQVRRFTLAFVLLAVIDAVWSITGSGGGAY